MKFTITNDFGVEIELFLEPEGFIYELAKDESVGIELSPCDGVCVDIQIQKDENRPSIAIWPQKGDYKIEDSRNII